MSSMLVDLEDLVCPGCGEQVQGELPATEELTEQEFSHTDGIPPCRVTGSQCPAEPIEKAGNRRDRPAGFRRLHQLWLSPQQHAFMTVRYERGTAPRLGGPWRSGCPWKSPPQRPISSLGLSWRIRGRGQATRRGAGGDLQCSPGPRLASAVRDR
jgi:hypothetical protein